MTTQPDALKAAWEQLDAAATAHRKAWLRIPKDGLLPADDALKAAQATSFALSAAALRYAEAKETR